MNKLKLFSILGLITLSFACAKPKTDQPVIKPPITKPVKDNRVFLWVDASANYVPLSSQVEILRYVQKAKEIGVTDLVVDIKGTSGEVLYNSTIAPMLLSWKGATRTRDFDYLGIFIQEAHDKGLKVFVAMNQFAGGNRSTRTGTIFQDTEKYTWQSYTYCNDGVIRPTAETSESTEIMLNPSLKVVRDYQLSIIQEVITKYPTLDGVTLDRGRFDGGMKGDYSNESRKQFETFLGRTVVTFPQDILTWNPDGSYQPGILFAKWAEWRCSVIYNYINDVKTLVKQHDQKMEFADYCGAWYSSYFEVGVNWASNRYSPYDVSGYRTWATTSYFKYGFAQLLDVLLTGNYSYDVTLQESAGWSVESMANNVNIVTMKDTKVHAGIYLNDYVKNGVMDGAQVEKAIEMCFRKSEGVMLFDVIYFDLYNCWESVGRGIERGKNL